MNPGDPVFKVLNCAKKDKKIWNILNNLRICDLKSLSEVAGKENFNTSHISLPATTETEILCDEKSQELFSEWSSIIAKFKNRLSNNYKLVHGKNIFVFYISMWDRFEFFSPSFDCIIEEKFRIWLRHLEGKFIYKALGSNESNVLIDFNSLETFRVEEKCVFIGSNQNWGHWIYDYLPQIVLAEALQSLNQVKFVFGKLDECQLKSLKSLGIEEDKIINLETITQGNGVVRFFRFDDILLLPPVAKSTGLHYLRERFHAGLEPIKDQFKRIFISRRLDYPKHRIANIDEIERVFLDQGFTVVRNMKSLSYHEQFQILHDADVVAFVSGAEFGNVAFLPSNAKIIVLLAAYFVNIKKNLELIDAQLIPYLFSSGLKTTLIAGKSLNNNDFSTHALAYYDPEHVREMISM